ncbi:MAG: AtpZ/AtpI family protein [Terriglobales bacterium]
MVSIADPETRHAASLRGTFQIDWGRMDESNNKRPDQSAESPEQKRSVWLLVAKYGHVGFILPACVIVGLLIGSALDKRLGTKSLMLVGIIFGSIAGFVELIRVMMKASKD